MIKRAVLITLIAVNAVAQTPADRKELAKTLPHLLESLYVLPDKGKELAALVRASFESGKYDAATTPAALAEAINADLASANDRHLRMRYNAADAATPVLTIDAWNARRAAMASGAPRERDARAMAAARAENYGVLAAEVLEGNVGYLRMRGFMAPDEARTAISHAMALLANTDAVIVDVRTCPGGSAETASYLASYFFDAAPRVLMKRYNRPANQTMDSTTVDVPGQRRPNVPLFILTGPTSASACESFAFTMQQWGRAKTVGEKTAGAGYNNMIIDLGLGLSASISIGTATHPKTNKQFEKVGVVPDIAVATDRALETAQAEARRALAPKTSAVTVPASKLDDYVGKYGVREVTLRDGALYFQRIGARGGVLKPIGADRFDLNGEVVIAFQRGAGGTVTSLNIEWKDGRIETVPRD